MNRIFWSPKIAENEQVNRVFLAFFLSGYVDGNFRLIPPKKKSFS